MENEQANKSICNEYYSYKQMRNESNIETGNEQTLKSIKDISYDKKIYHYGKSGRRNISMNSIYIPRTIGIYRKIGVLTDKDINRIKDIDFEEIRMDDIIFDEEPLISDYIYDYATGGYDYTWLENTSLKDFIENPYGKAAEVKLVENCYFQVVINAQEVDVDYLSIYLMSEPGKLFFESLCMNSENWIISQAVLEKAQLPVPTLDEQLAIKEAYRVSGKMEAAIFQSKNEMLETFDTEGHSKKILDIFSANINALRDKYKSDKDETSDNFWENIDALYNSSKDRIISSCGNRGEIIKFLKESDPTSSCWDKLDDECKNMLISAEIVYRTLSERDDAELLDYSPCMIPLTKVVEYKLNELYSKVKKYIDLNDSDSKRYGRNFIELGPALRMLSSGYIKTDFNRKMISEKPHDEYVVNNKDRRLAWHIDDFVNWAKLAEFEGIKIQCCGFDDPQCKRTLLLPLTKDCQKNRIRYIATLEYIRNAYRNKVAHKDGIKKSRMDFCREDMLMTQKSIWMLVYILQ